MFGLSRRLTGLCAAALVSAPLVSHAGWVETRVKAHTALVDVDAKGSAEVTHEIVLGVRGGPLRTFEIQGIDADAVLAEEEAAAVPVVRFGTPTPIPLALAKQDDGTLRVEIQRERGLFTGTYQLRFSYRTELLARDRIRRRGTSAEVEWVGPRFADGIDVAKVVFRIPSGASAPTLDTGSEGEGAWVGSAFLASTRHVGEKEELEIVRPHVARGEPAVWRVLADPKAFLAFRDAAPAATPQQRAARVISVERPSEQLLWALAASLVAVAYGGLVAGKWRLFARDTRARGLEPRAWVRLPAPLRAALAGAVLASAATLGALGDYPFLATVLLLVSMVLAATRSPKLGPLPRGPGRWLALTDEEAFERRALRLHGRFLDSGDVRGRLLFALLFAGFLVAAAMLAGKSAYTALSVVMGAGCLLPIFMTGRAANLPVDRVRGAQPLLLGLARALRKQTGLRVVPWARVPEGQRDPDELRLLVRTPRLLDGVLAIEIGVEYLASAGGFFAQPFALVRVREDSAAERALTSGVRWQRGRQANERVAITKSPLPTLGPAQTVVLELIARLSDAPRPTARRTRPSVTAPRLAIPSPAHTP